MTDAEIIKALPFLAKYCKDEYNDIRIDNVLFGAFDLINRQKAEIERLKSGVNVELDNYASEYDSKIKAEAVKEFAERLKESKHECGCNYRKKPVYAVTEEKIDCLLKEMAGDMK